MGVHGSAREKVVLQLWTPFEQITVTIFPAILHSLQSLHYAWYVVSDVTGFSYLKITEDPHSGNVLLPPFFTISPCNVSYAASNQHFDKPFRSSWSPCSGHT